MHTLQIASRLGLLPVAMAFVWLFSFANSPLYLGYSGDAAVYQQMGRLILKGGAPYVDMCDNKGILLYLFYALGLLINPHWGVAMLQSAMLFLTLLLWERMLSLYIKGIGWRWLFLAVALLLLLSFYEGGGLTEDISLPIITLPIYLFLRAKRQQQSIPMRDWTIMGLCMGSILFIRVNNALPFLWLYAGAAVEELSHGRWRTMLRDVGVALIAFMVISGICVSVVYGKGGHQALTGMMNWMFLINFDRLIFSSGAIRLQPTLFVPMVSFSFLAIITFKKDWKVYIAILLAMLCVAVSVAKRSFPHYEVVLIPLYVGVMGASFSRYRLLSLLVPALAALCQVGVLHGIVIRTRREVLLGKVWFREGAEQIDRLSYMLPEKEDATIFNLAGWPGFSACNRMNVVASNHATFFVVEQEFHQIATSGNTSAYPQYILLGEGDHVSTTDSLFIVQEYVPYFRIGEYSYKNLTLLRRNPDQTCIFLQ